MAHVAVRPAARERVIRSFTDAAGRAREILARDEGAGTTVFERPVDRGDEPRVVGVLECDEPQSNAVLLADLFAADAAVRPIRCRVLGRGAADTRPLDQRAHEASNEVSDGLARVWRIRPVQGTMTVAELRWLDDAGEIVSVRDVVAGVQAYGPVREATEASLGASGVSTAALRAELERLLESPILLNRALRERVTAEIASGALSMGEIAARCGRTKRDGTGTRSGDTSWLARRVGLLPEAGRGEPTPWVHTEVLALIARTGLGVSPREVETP